MKGLQDLLAHGDPNMRRQGEALLASLSPEEAARLLSRLRSWERLCLDGLTLTTLKMPMSLGNFFLRDADLSGISLRNRTLEDVQLHRTRLPGVDLRGARLRTVGACGVELSGADLSDGVWDMVALDGAVLADATAAGLALTGGSLLRADLRRLRAPGLCAPGLMLRGADLRGADLTGAVLTGADLRDTDLRGADLTGADLRHADLRDAILEGARLEGARLDEALTDDPAEGSLVIGPGADLRGRILAGQDLAGADLQGADLRGADLRGTVLDGARLEDADLRGAVRLPEEGEATWDRPVRDWTGRDLRGAVVDAEALGAVFSLGFWVDGQTQGAPAAVLQARGGVLVPAGWHAARWPRRERAVWARALAPVPEEVSTAVPLLPGMWVWTEEGTGGRWVRRLHSDGGGSGLVATAPARLGRRLADLHHRETWEAALLWLALSLGAPPSVPGERMHWAAAGRGWRLSLGIPGGWGCFIPAEIPYDASPVRALVLAWEWAVTGREPVESRQPRIFGNPSPPGRWVPVTPEDFRRLRGERRGQREEAALYRRQQGVVDLWLQRRSLQVEPG